MNDIDKMPSKCQGCPYWEACEYPHICDDMKPKQAENDNINAESAENLRNRPTNGDLISRQAAIDAIHCDITVTGRQNAELVAATIGAFADRIKALPAVQVEPLTDREQRIFLAAMGREEKVCKQVDEEWRDCREPYEDSLVRVCHEITRKVKGALWT